MTHVAGSLASLQHKHNKQRNIQFRSANVSNQLQRNNNNNLIIIIIYLIRQMAANSKIHNEHKSQ